MPRGRRAGRADAVPRFSVHRMVREHAEVCRRAILEREAGAAERLGALA